MRKQSSCQGLFLLTGLAAFISWQVHGADFTAPEASHEGNPLFLASGSVPEGFEELSRPQRSLVDIYYGNRYLGSQLAIYTPRTIRFSDPATIVRQIGSISNQPLVAEGLSGEINTHSDQICYQQGQTNCGTLEPTIAGVIFDESRFRVDVFVSPQFLVTREADVGKYLPPSDGGFSFLQNFSAAVSGSHSSGNNSSDNTDDYTLYGNSLMAFGEDSVYASWDYSKTNHFSMDSLYAQREFEGVNYRGGMMNSEGFGLSFTSDKTLTGVRLGSSDNTRTDTSFTGGMPLDVFLPVRGRVEVRRDDRLIASFFLEAGSQQLDTSAFPSGAYDVEIKILDEQGNPIKTETRFFAKQFDLPPAGEWRYFMEAGQVMDRTSDTAFPEMTHQLIARGGVSRRLTDTLAASLSSALNTTDHIIEAGLFNIGYFYELSPSFMVGNNGAYGANVIGRLSLGDITMNASYRRLWNNDYNSDITDDDYPTLLGESFRQGSYSFSTPVYDGNASYRFSENKTADEDTTRTHTVSYRTSLYQIADIDIDMDMSYSQSDEDKVALLSVNFRFREDHWTFRATPKAERNWKDSGNTHSERMRVAATWEDKDLFDSTIRADIGAETGTGDERYDARLEVGNTWGRGDLSLNHVNGDGFNATSYAASFRSSFMSDGNHTALGGEQNADSALMVNVTGQEGDVFDVSVNGQRRGYAVVGRPSLVPLTPYENYTVSISPSGTALYDFDERERSVTLYPGNVVTLDYDAVALQLLFGRLMLNGEPLSGAQIRDGLYPADSDDMGLFQLELRSDKKNIHVELDNGTTCSLPVPEQQGNVLRMGTIDLKNAQCVISDQKQPPSDPQQQFAEQEKATTLAELSRPKVGDPL
ncbi:putative outer membrane usher protein EcpC [invertebrate metagenome]|uniref:Putative outer membrane usher protein EcpC n=1 Tax=invertebrate metagenome TaxID=1711999 RepID=A0A2H9TBL5_9ZZZZ